MLEKLDAASAEVMYIARVGEQSITGEGHNKFLEETGRQGGVFRCLGGL